MKDDNRETQAPNVPGAREAAENAPVVAKKEAGGGSGTHSMNVRASDAKKAKKEGADSVLDEVVAKVREAENVLVALSNDPNVDEMAAAIGLSILLEALGKHATAIYSGKTPNVLEFLKPEETFETNTNGLQDFIIELDKEKADHLRYKVDGDFVKVYITPYRTTLSQGDLAFSRGDFNVDLVISLNVAAATELDAALREYGRIMHDATAINITNGVPGKFGDVEWVEPKASSVSEMVAELALALKEDLDQSVATALLTGIVAATDKFANESTTPEAMMIAAKLMKFGANQQEVFKNISQELEYVEREVAEAEVSSATEELARETEQVSDGEMKVNEGGAAADESVVEGGAVAGAVQEGAEQGVAQEGDVSGEPVQEEPKESVIVTPEEGEEKAEGESLADQILSKIHQENGEIPGEIQGVPGIQETVEAQGARGVQDVSGVQGVQGGVASDYGQMIDQVSAEPMPGEQGMLQGASGMVPGAVVEAPMGTMSPNVATPVDSAQEEAAAMDVIRQANSGSIVPEGTELPTVVPGGGSSVNPAMNVPAISPASAPVAEVPAMDFSPLETTPTVQPAGAGSGVGMVSGTASGVVPEAASGAVEPAIAGGGLPMPGQELGVPPVPPMPDFSTMPTAMPPSMETNTLSSASADVPAGSQAMSPAGMPMGAMPGEPVAAPSSPSMADPGSFQIPPVAF